MPIGVTVWIALVVAGVASGCRKPREMPPDDIDHEAHFDDDDLVCRQTREIIAAGTDGRKSFKLPGLAYMVARGYEVNGLLEDCGDQLFQWIAAALDRRPVDLRPRLHAPVVALGTFIATYRWNEKAIAVGSRLLLDESPAESHWARHFSGAEPGIPKMWDEMVTRDDLDTWVSQALVRGHVGLGFSSSPLLPSDPYADLLAAYTARRYAVPPSDPALRGSRLIPTSNGAPRIAPPLPALLGCREAPLDLLWPDLVKAYRTAPDTPRWKQLPEAVRRRLQTSETMPACDFKLRLP